MSSCTLSADQEATLNRSINNHLSAMNEGRMLQYLSEIHPLAVRYYKDKGDSVFEAHFELKNMNSEVYYQDPIIKQIEKEGDVIHVEFEVLEISSNLFDEQASPLKVFALSSDNGKTWYFLHDNDYTDDHVLKKEERLINIKQ